MDYLQQLTERYPQLKAAGSDIKSAFDIISGSFSGGGKLLIAGNGGSASDAQHIVGELMKSFVKKRSLPESFINELRNINSEFHEFIVSRLQPGLPAIALCEHSSLNTACINDIDGKITFAQQVYGYGKENDVFWGISTSGSAKNILYACAVAKAKKLKVIGLTGESGGMLKQYTDVCICVPETETYKIQELHLPVYHIICMMLEDYFF